MYESLEVRKFLEIRESIEMYESFKIHESFEIQEYLGIYDSRIFATEIQINCIIKKTHSDS